MKTEPQIEKADLKRALRRAYDIDAARLDFLPTEWGAYNYVVHSAVGECTFLKIFDDTGSVGIAASSRAFFVPLTYELHARDILTHLPYPLLTVDGQLYIPFGPYWLVLNNYIEGMTIGFGNMPDAILAELAGLVGILHRNTSELSLRNPFVDDFGMLFKAQLLEILDRLRGLPSDATKGAQNLQELVLPHRAILLTTLQRVQSLGAMARESGKPTVVCHTDLHGGNLMVDAEDKLYILDWENAMLAPPEHDLFMFASDDRFREIFVPNYESEYGPMHMDADLLSFYTYRRRLEDLTAYLARILHGDGGAIRDQADLREIAEHLAALPFLETLMAEIAQR